MVELCKNNMYKCCLANLGSLVQLMVALNEVVVVQIMLKSLKSLESMKG